MKKNPRRMANFSLFIMFIGFFIMLSFQETWWQKLLLGGFEAGVVGALADWFAVTALFRHPLGIPIPHTALLPKNREKLTKSLINTLENDWLNKESVEEKIKSLNLTDNVLSFIEREMKREGNQQKIQSMFDKTWLRLNKNHKLSEQLLDRMLKIATDEKIEKLSVFLAKTIISEIEKRKADSLFNVLLKTIKGILNRERLEDMITKILKEKREELKKRENLQRITFLSYIEKETKNFTNDPVFIQNQILKLIDKAKKNPKNLQEIELWLKERIVGFAEENHSKIGQLVETNLNKLNHKELSIMIEEKLGKDLSWIRVNGAICGFIIGVVLTIIKFQI